jgi:HEPN domain-containing protein
MPLEESLYPQDWFSKARQDVRTVEILLREEGDAEVAGFHLQQAVEKYLKGYLLSQGWELQRIHNLEILLNEATSFAPEMERFRELCEEATDFYTLERYPFFASPGITLEDVSHLLTSLRRLIEQVEEMVGRGAGGRD